MSFNNIGQPIPEKRKEAAYQLLKEFGVARELAWNASSVMANHLEKDRPYEAIEAAQKVCDLTGAYRLMAVLLTDAS